MAGDVEIVPGLTAKAGFQSHAGQGTGQCWTHLSGDQKVLEILSRPGILPVRHEWIAEIGHRIKTIAVDNVGERERRQDPNWLAGYIHLLRNQMKQRGGPFIASSISRPMSKLDRGKYRISILTRDGKKLSGSDGRPFWWPHYEP